TFTNADRAGSQLVAVIDQELASHYFGGEDPIGKEIGSGGAGTPARIIGIVGSVHNSDLVGPRKPQVYYPDFQDGLQSTYLGLRMKNDAVPSAAVRHTIAKIDPSVALYDVQCMDIRVSESLSLRRFVAFLLNGLALTGIGLAVVGLYASL